MDENRELLTKTSITRPSRFLNELKNKFLKNSTDISTMPTNETNSSKKIFNKKTFQNDTSYFKSKSNPNKSEPFSTHKNKLKKNPSQEFLQLKNSIEKQLLMPSFQLTTKPLNENNKFSINPIHLDSLGSAMTTDQSANMSLTSFSSSSINDLSHKIKLNSKIPTRVKYFNDKTSKQQEFTYIKPKLIDLEFKNELERLFSGINDQKRSSSVPKIAQDLKKANNTKPETSSSDTAPKRLLAFSKASKSRDNSYSSKFEKRKQNKCSDKLKNLFSLISGNLILDYSDLLVGFRDDKLFNDELTESSNSDETSPTKTYNLFKSLDFEIEEIKTIDNEKLIQFLIDIMVKSCRMYDVATMKTDDKMSYWRYANPIVAAYKSKTKNSSQFKLTSKFKQSKKKSQIDSSTQTYNQTDLYEESNNTSIGTEIVQNTVIEAKPFQTIELSKCKDENLLTQSIIDLISESLSLSIGKTNNQNGARKMFQFRPLVNTSNNYSKTSYKEVKRNSLAFNVNSPEDEVKILKNNHQEDIEEIELEIRKEEEFLKKNHIEFNHQCQASKEFYNHREDQQRDNELFYFNKTNNKNNKEGDSYDDEEEEEDDKYDNNNKSKLVRETITNSSKSINKKRLTHYGIRSSSKNNNLDNNKMSRHSFLQRRSIRIQNNINNSKAQDETLRDAENISDIDNELDIDQWADISNSNLNSNNKNPSGDRLNLNKNTPMNTIKKNNEDFKISLTRTANNAQEEVKEEEVNFIEDNHIINKEINNSSTSLSILSTPLSLSSDSNRNNKGDTLFNTTLNVCHLLATNDLEQPLAKLKSPKHISEQVNLENKKIVEEIEKENIINKKIKKQKKVEEIIENMENLATAKLTKGRNTSSTSIKSTQAGIIKKIERTHSLDSLENDEFDEVLQSNKHIVIDAQNHSDFNVDFDINISRIDPITNSPISGSGYNIRNKLNNNNKMKSKQELSEIPEIKIDFEYQIKRSDNASPNAHEDIVKKRARESLKFWKEEEEKRKQHESSSSLNNSYSIMSNATSSSTSNDQDRKSIDQANEQQLSPSVTIKRVKDRINVFETIKDTVSEHPLNLSKGLAVKKSKQDVKKPIQLVPTSNDAQEPQIQSIQSRIRTFEESINKKKTELSVSPIQQEQDSSDKDKINFKDYSPRDTSYKKISSSRSLDCELDAQTNESCIRIPIILTTRVNSNSNYSIKNFTYQINHQLEKKKVYNQSLGDLASQDLEEIKQIYPPNDDQYDNNNDYEEEINHYEEEQINHFSDHQDMHDKSATSQTSFLSSNLIVDNHTLTNSKIRDQDDSEDLEEVEIIIDLNNLNKSNQVTIRTEAETISNEDLSILVDERLKNIVMHMIPTTRKAYIDDIVDGIKLLINDTETLNQISSPIDLPKHVVKFIQKRYSSLLNEPNISTTAIEADIIMDDDSKNIDSQNDTTSNNNNIIDTTTEVTVVKEIRKEFLLPSESESNLNNDDIMRVEEETLYIVEKRRPIPVSILSNKSSSAITNEVDKEIRKNFELKPKDLQHETRFLNTVKFDINKTVALETSNDEQPIELENDTSTSVLNNSTQHFYIEPEVNQLVNELKSSFEFKNDDINDYQLHFFELNLKQNKFKKSVLLMVYDKDNHDNYRFNLEKKYHKSIIDTHVTNKKNDINIVAHLNIYFINDQSSDDKTAQFDSFSLIRPPTTSEDIASITNRKMFNSLPIGKYFVDIKYQRLLGNNEIEYKQSLIDLSLLPLPIRTQLIYELEMNKADNPVIELMIINNSLMRNKINKNKENLIREIFRKHSVNMDESMKYIILSNIHNLGLLRSEFSENDLSDNPELDNLIKILELELNSFYICEQVINYDLKEHQLSLQKDLVKLNRIDALVSFECAQKYRDILMSFIEVNINNSNQSSYGDTFEPSQNMFYLLDKGKYYKCLLPVGDLINNTNSVLAVDYSKVDKSLHHSVSIIDPKLNTRQTFIFCENLPFQISFDDIRSFHLKQINSENEFQMSLDKLSEDDDNLPSFSESISESLNTKFSNKNQLINTTQDEEKFKRDFLFNLTKTSDMKTKEPSQKLITKSTSNFSEASLVTNELNDNESKHQAFINNYNESNQSFINNDSFDYLNQQCRQYPDTDLTQFETDRLKLDLHLNNIASFNAKQIRDKIIIDEIDKMFSSIRDHQGSTAKAKREEDLVKLYDNNYAKKKKGFTWSYSSTKRHVRAKIMELPIAEDITKLAETIGINDLMNINESQEDTIEKVFVRIDDYLNQEVSKSMQRSYSVDYLNHLCSGPRTRIRYIRIPGQTIKTQSMMSCSYTNPTFVTPEEASTEYRTAPYDLRYWSILKLLEEERNLDNGQLLNFFDDSYNCTDWSRENQSVQFVPNQNLSQKIETNMGDISYNDCVMTSLDIDKDLEKFLSMHDLDKEIERVKKERASTRTLDETSSTSTMKKPQYIIKEKMSVKKPELIQPMMERIDAELSKLEQSGLIEKMDLQSVEFINRNQDYNQLIKEYLKNNSIKDNYEIICHQNQTSSIIPESESVQNEGIGLQVPHNNTMNVNLSEIIQNSTNIPRNTLTTKLQDLIISSPKKKYNI